MDAGDASNRSSSRLRLPLASIYRDGERYPLRDQVVKNIETILGMQAQAVSQLPIHERVLTKIASFFGKPQFLYFQLIFFFSWWLWSHFSSGPLPGNLLKFDLQEMGIDVASLLIATGVLIQQNRQDKLADQRSHLMLQINLLTEQKTAKLIELMEELRADLPDLRDRNDWEAKVMQQAADPQVVLNILQENLDQLTEESNLPLSETVQLSGQRPDEANQACS
ncbi:MAG: DUF1003 domain-containing protein [Leptolyngbya sp. SIO4C1]|nr:DUF1003 domain-containing protein [Leptolyngbya sp. SIO4C1]